MIELLVHRRQVRLGHRRIQSAQPVIAAELHHRNRGAQRQHLRQACYAVLGGIAADALVVNAVAVVQAIEIGLQIVGIALSGSCAMPLGQAVAKADQHRPPVIFVLIPPRRCRTVVIRCCPGGRLRGRRIARRTAPCSALRTRSRRRFRSALRVASRHR